MRITVRVAIGFLKTRCKPPQSIRKRGIKWSLNDNVMALTYPSRIIWERNMKSSPWQLLSESMGEYERMTPESIRKSKIRRKRTVLDCGTGYFPNHLCDDALLNYLDVPKQLIQSILCRLYFSAPFKIKFRPDKCPKVRIRSFNR